MSKYVVVIFPTEEKAYEGTKAFDRLASEGSITLYGIAVIGKDVNSRITVKQAVDEGPLGFGVGALVGGFVGLIGGPIGAAIGMSSGAMIGGLSDINNAGVGTDFVNEVSEKLAPGKFAVITEVNEEWVTPLNTSMEAIGGVVIREWRSVYENEQRLENEALSRESELRALKEEVAQSSDDRKDKLNELLYDAKEKLQEIAQKTEDKISQLDVKTEAKVEKLKKQGEKVSGNAGLEIERQISILRADAASQAAKLRQAWAAAKRALA